MFDAVYISVPEKTMFRALFRADFDCLNIEHKINTESVQAVKQAKPRVYACPEHCKNLFSHNVQEGTLLSEHNPAPLEGAGFVQAGRSQFAGSVMAKVTRQFWGGLIVTLCVAGSDSASTFQAQHRSNLAGIQCTLINCNFIARKRQRPCIPRVFNLWPWSINHEL